MKIDPSFLIVESYVSSSAGSFSVAEGGVRITHKPTGISRKWEGERSSHKNKAIALNMLEKAVEEHYIAIGHKDFQHHAPFIMKTHGFGKVNEHQIKIGTVTLTATGEQGCGKTALLNEIEAHFKNTPSIYRRATIGKVTSQREREMMHMSRPLELKSDTDGPVPDICHIETGWGNDQAKLAQEREAAILARIQAAVDSTLDSVAVLVENADIRRIEGPYVKFNVAFELDQLAKQIRSTKYKEQ